MHYEWDGTKRRTNLRKHGVDFADAVGALERTLRRVLREELRQVA